MSFGIVANRVDPVGRPAHVTAKTEAITCSCGYIHKSTRLKGSKEGKLLEDGKAKKEQKNKNTAANSRANSQMESDEEASPPWWHSVGPQSRI